MSEKYKFRDPEGLYFVTCTVVQWIDLFTRNEFKHVILDSLKYCQKEKGLVVHAWCLMPSHLHMIVSSKSSLSGIFRDFKKYTSKRIVKELEITNESRKVWLMRAFEKSGEKLKRIKNHKVWQDGNHPIQLESNKFIDQKLDYIHNNPVGDEIVDEPEFYLYSSARDYSGKKGILDIKLLV